MVDVITSLILYDLNGDNWSAVNVYSLYSSSGEINPIEFDEEINLSGSPSLSTKSIIWPLWSKFLYPGNGVNIGSKFWFSLIA